MIHTNEVLNKRFLLRWMDRPNGDKFSQKTYFSAVVHSAFTITNEKQSNCCFFQFGTQQRHAISAFAFIISAIKESQNNSNHTSFSKLYISRSVFVFVFVSRVHFTFFSFSFCVSVCCRLSCSILLFICVWLVIEVFHSVILLRILFLTRSFLPIFFFIFSLISVIVVFISFVCSISRLCAMHAFPACVCLCVCVVLALNDFPSHTHTHLQTYSAAGAQQ